MPQSYVYVLKLQKYNNYPKKHDEAMLFFKKRVLFGLLSSSFFLSVSVGDDPFRKRKKRQHVGDDEAQGKCGDENQ